jgi:hypothetical protein
MRELPTETDEEQRRIAALVRSFDAPAPESLHRRIEALVAGSRGSRAAGRPLGRDTRRRPGRRAFSVPAFAAVTALAAATAAAVVIAFGPGSGTGAVPTLRQAIAPTLLAATLPAPWESPAHRSRLAAAVDGVPFPYWKDRFGLRGSGARSDRIDGRAITTVFYTDARGARIGYAILSGAPAPRISGGAVAWRGGVPYRLLAYNGASVVAWLRDGHLCVVSGRGLSSAELLRLANWSDGGARAS